MKVLEHRGYGLSLLQWEMVEVTRREGGEGGEESGRKGFGGGMGARVLGKEWMSLWL